jgi:hypothetical protein
MFSPQELKQLAELEEQYLNVSKILREYPNDEEALQKIT